MPPLYVGRTRNLRRRYSQHLSGRAPRARTFASRFASFTSERQLKLRVRDLLFVCIGTPSDIAHSLDRSPHRDLNALIERVLMQFCRPPFSLR